MEWMGRWIWEWLNYGIRWWINERTIERTNTWMNERKWMDGGGREGGGTEGGREGGSEGGKGREGEGGRGREGGRRDEGGGRREEGGGRREEGGRGREGGREGIAQNIVEMSLSCRHLSEREQYCVLLALLQDIHEFHYWLKQDRAETQVSGQQTFHLFSLTLVRPRNVVSTWCMSTACPVCMRIHVSTHTFV